MPIWALLETYKDVESLTACFVLEAPYSNASLFSDPSFSGIMSQFRGEAMLSRLLFMCFPGLEN